jgi:hypothetical protein
MAGLLCSSYKERMGRFDGMSMQFDFGYLLKKVEGRDELTIPLGKKWMKSLKRCRMIEHWARMD